METRLIIAYTLIVLMVLAAGALLFVARYNAHPRATARQRLRDKRHRDVRGDARNAERARRLTELAYFRFRRHAMAA